MKLTFSEVPMKKAIKLVLCLFGLLSFYVNASSIVVSVKPLQLITNELTQGVLEPELLISSNASPHDYAMKPSDLKKIKQADLVIWFGPDLESFLAKAIGEGKNSMPLSQSGVTLREFGDAHASDDHHGHSHGSHDPHIWLGPLQAKEIAQAIYQKLVELNPEHKERYTQNYVRFTLQLAEVVKRIETQLVPYKKQGYYVFHNAYGYFESYFNLNKSGHFTLSPERKPGAKTLIQIRTALKKGDAQCVFTEPQFKPSVVKSVTRGSDVFIGTLDPLATEIESKEGAYFEFLQSLADSYQECLGYKIK